MLWDSHNPSHNILELYSVLVKVRFVTSKRKLNIYNNKLSNIRFAPRVTKQFETTDLRELGNFRKISN